MIFQSYVARQPILDRHRHIAFYELLYRRLPKDDVAQVQENDTATITVLINSLMDIGLDVLAPDYPVLINVTREQILSNRDLILDNKRIGLELLENTPVDACLIEAISELIGKGFTIALDDFIYHHDYDPLLELVQLVKIDILTLTKSELERQLGLLRKFPVSVLAEKVETQEQFEYCRSLNFDYYQGFFFAKPKIISGAALRASQLSKLRLLGELQNADISIDRIKNLVDQDVGLSYKLLRYINSAFFSLPKTLTGIREAIMYLGLRAMRVWISMMVVADEDIGNIAMKQTALQRARFCEALAEKMGMKELDSYFTVGLFSTLDALLGIPMVEVLERLPLEASLKAAINEQQGPQGRLLRCIMALERGQWSICDELNLSEQTVNTAYLQALKWAGETSRIIG